MRSDPDETGELRIMLEDMSVVRVFVRRTSKATTLAEGDLEITMSPDSTPAQWAREWSERRGRAAIKDLIYADVRTTVSSYGPKSRVRRGTAIRK
jgi:hypothetical protein